jgi:hypothetical protein
MTAGRKARSGAADVAGCYALTRMDRSDYAALLAVMEAGGVIGYSTLFVSLAAAATGAFMTYKGAGALWQVRHHVLPAA